MPPRYVHSIALQMKKAARVSIHVHITAVHVPHTCIPHEHVNNDNTYPQLSLAVGPTVPYCLHQMWWV